MTALSTARQRLVLRATALLGDLVRQQAAAPTSSPSSAAADALSRDAALGLGLLADVLRRPLLPEAEFDKERRTLLGSGEPTR